MLTFFTQQSVELINKKWNSLLVVRFLHFLKATFFLEFSQGGDVAFLVLRVC